MVELVFGIIDVSIKVTVPLKVGDTFVAYIVEAFVCVK
jgi:hypothetical protein